MHSPAFPVKRKGCKDQGAVIPCPRLWGSHPFPVQQTKSKVKRVVWACTPDLTVTFPYALFSARDKMVNGVSRSLSWLEWQGSRCIYWQGRHLSAWQEWMTECQTVYYSVLSSFVPFEAKVGLLFWEIMKWYQWTTWAHHIHYRRCLCEPLHINSPLLNKYTHQAVFVASTVFRYHGGGGYIWLIESILGTTRAR